MKVAILSFFMMETSMPLAKHLSAAGIDVDLYSLLPYGNQNTYVFDFIKDQQPIGFVKADEQRTAFGEMLCNYVSNINTKIFIWPTKRLQRLFLIDLYYGYLLAKHVSKQDYDIVHIIHASTRFWVCLFLFLKKKKIIQTLHEVSARDEKTAFLDALRLKWLRSHSIPVIFHSNASKDRFISLQTRGKEICEKNLTMIRFGLFETYQCFKSKLPGRSVKKDKINIVTFGRITPSKGINLLVDAVRILQNRFSIHLVVAGYGTPDFDFNGISSYEFINRFISNNEIVNLIESSDVVVLPYLSASQSGIPMTVYSFDKPIIASNIAGLKEVIEHLKTGILVDHIDAQSFASAIETLILNEELRNEMSRNIKEKYGKGQFSWSCIANETINFYNKHLNEKSNLSDIGTRNNRINSPAILQQ